MRTVAYWLALALIFTIPAESFVELPGLGTLSRLVALAAGAVWLFSVAGSGTVRKPTLFHGLIFLFICWNFASIFWSISQESSIKHAFLYVRMVGLVLICWDLFATESEYRAGLQSYVLGLYVPVLSVIVNYSQGDPDVTRFTASGLGANGTATVAALGLPVALYLAFSAAKNTAQKVLRIVNLVYVPAALFGIALTATRFGMIMAMPAIVFGVASLARLKLAQRTFVFVLLTIGMVGVATAVPESNLRRLGTVVDEISYGDLNGRVGFWREGLEVWMSNPILGVGSGTFLHAVESGRDSHNSFIMVLTELGVIGFLLFGLVVAMALALAWKHPKWEFRFWITLLTVWLLGNLAISMADSKRTWFLLAMLAVSAGLKRYRSEVDNRGLLDGDNSRAYSQQYSAHRV
jgi:O-antigen ligase